MFERDEAATSAHEARYGGRNPLTVGDMKRLLGDVSDDTPFKVMHQPNYDPLGICDPLVKGLREVAGQVFDEQDKRFYLTPPSKRYFIVG